MVKMSACRAVTEWVRLPYRPLESENNGSQKLADGEKVITKHC